MKTIIVVVLGVLLIQGCKTQPEPAAPSNAGNAKVRVYFTGHGPSPQVERLSRFVAFALEDEGMTMATDRKGADAILEANIVENKRQLNFYYYAYKIDAFRPRGASSPMQWSSSTSLAVGVSHDTEREAEAAFPYDFAKEFTGATSVYVGEARSDGGKDIAEPLKRELERARYKLASQPDGADVVLKQVQLRTCLVPVSLAEEELTIEGRSHNQAEPIPIVSATQMVKKSFKESTAPDFKDCAELARTHSNDSDTDAFWYVAHNAAVALRSQFTAH